MTGPKTPLDLSVNAPATSQSIFQSPVGSLLSSHGSHGREPAGSANSRYRDDGTASAYATSLYPNAASNIFGYASLPPSANANPTADQQFQVGTSLGAHGNQYSTPQNFGHFGSQDWVAPTPYLEFAPQLIYEQTGELASEQIASFKQFDTPSNITSTAAPPQSGAELTSGDPLNVQVPTSLSGSGSVFVTPPLPKSALKRKQEQESAIQAEAATTKPPQPNLLPGRTSRSAVFDRMSASLSPKPDDGSRSADRASGSKSTQTNVAASARRSRPTAVDRNLAPRVGASTAQNVNQLSSAISRNSQNPTLPQAVILPAEKVFPIQIGSELFRLSGASIASDSPSYFTQYFEDQIRQNEDGNGVKTLTIDRDPVTFRDIARHLQGYYVKPIDGSHFVKLFADAQFYSLPRLIDQLFESEIFIQIGERHFQIPKDIFSDPGNSPNFFSLSFAVFFSTPDEVFPGLDRRGLLRPPSIVPPCVPNRSPEIFVQLMHLLRGYPLHIRDEDHRAELLRDCRYFHLRGLEQKLVAHEISYNPERQKNEISIRLEDVKPSGVSLALDEDAPEHTPTGWVSYARPFVDELAAELIIEIGNECTVLDLNDMRADFHGLAKARVASLLQVVANKMNLPTNAPLGLLMLSGGVAQAASPSNTPLSEDRVKVLIESSTDVILDGRAYDADWASMQGRSGASFRSADVGSSERDIESDVVSETATPRATRSTMVADHQPQAPPLPPSPAPRLPDGSPMLKKRKREASSGLGGSSSLEHGARRLGEWAIRTGQWRLRVLENPRDSIRCGLEIVLVAVKIDAYSTEKARNARRSFLR